jgi:hypothetical protein
MNLHLWEIDHPFFGPDGNSNPCGSFAELRAAVNALDEGANHVYRWDWLDWSQPQHDDIFAAGEDLSGQEFVVYLVLPRLGLLINFTCPVTHDEEGEVLEWLCGPRVLGALRRAWAPLLEEAEVGAGG